MSKTFDDCMDFLLDAEGGYSNDPHDPGGETKYGISKRAHPLIDIKNLTRAGAAAIYKAEYWRPMRCDEMPAPIALCVFDMGVNMGITRSARTLQQAIGIPEDGIIGPQTLFEANDANAANVVQKIHTLRETFYRGLMNYERFGKGWLARNDACRDLALLWCTRSL